MLGPSSLVGTATEEELRGATLLLQIPWQRVVADEAQQIVCAQTLVARALLSLKAKSRWVLTGTPGQSASELWTLVRFAQAAKQAGSDDALRQVLQQCMLRRTRQQLQIPTTDPIIWQLSMYNPVQVHLCWAYACYALYARRHRLHPVPLLIQWLRQLCVEPALMRQLAVPPHVLLRNFDGQMLTEGPLAEFMARLPVWGHFRYSAPYAETLEWDWDPRPLEGMHYAVMERSLVQPEAEARETLQQTKYLPVDDSLNHLKHLAKRCLDMKAPSPKQLAVLRLSRQSGESDKMVGFCVSVRALENLAVFLRVRGFVVRCLSGRQSEQQNRDELEAFYSDRTTEEGRSVLLCSLKLGYAGLNLACANVVFFYDLWWNPAVHRQAWHRVQRLCQLKPVTIVFLAMQHSVEMYQLQLLMSKMMLLQRLVGEGVEQVAEAPDEVELDIGTGDGAQEAEDAVMPLNETQRAALFSYRLEHRYNEKEDWAQWPPAQMEPRKVLPKLQLQLAPRASTKPAKKRAKGLDK